MTGRLIEKYPTQQVSERFKKREFVLDITEEINGNSYPNFAKMQAVQNRCDMLDSYNVGDMLKVSFNIRGNKWEKDGRVNYITSLDAWRIERATQGDSSSYNAAPQQQQYGGTPSSGASGNFNSFPGGNSGVADDLPF
ncbi:MAG: DUF3127 domain-containing protein [Chitinophagaceae bacterium]